jgi:hypothetical protein
MNWPDVAELKDITVGPLVGASSKGNLVVAANPPSAALQHFRYGSGESALAVIPFPAPVVPNAIIDEPVIYGGLLFRHFGHALTESIHRLWPRYARRELHGAKVAFNLVNNTKIMPYITEALNFHGFSKSDIIPITEPILFRRLFVGRQARTLAGPTVIASYRTMLDRDLSRRLPPPAPENKIYVSRSRHRHTGTYYGETHIETELAKVGFEIVFPEDHSLTALVTMLRNASIAIFAEGSAIHALELCGSNVPATAVIARRPHAIPRFAPLLTDICERWTISDRLRKTAGMALDGKKHSGVLDLAAVGDDVREFAHLPGSFMAEPGALMAAIERDLERHILEARNDNLPDYMARAEHLREVVRLWAPH